jgi:hypothetical protein
VGVDGRGAGRFVRRRYAGPATVALPRAEQEHPTIGLDHEEQSTLLAEQVLPAVRAQAR